MTPEQRAAWFTYHAPTPETAPKYAAIRAVEVATVNAIVDAMTSAASDASDHEVVNAAALAFADAIVANAPACADRSAAIRCVRLARNAANEALAARRSRMDGGAPARSVEAMYARSVEAMYADMAIGELVKARWQANSAIACGGV